MISFRKYLAAQLKRMGRLFPFIAGMTLLSALAVMVLAAVLQRTQESDDSRKSVQIALTGETDNVYLQLGMKVLRKQIAGQYKVELEILSEDEARAKLRAGEISGYVVIPEGFVERINRGEEVEFLYAAGNDASALGGILADALVGRVEELADEMQRAVSGIWTLAAEYPTGKDPDALTDQLFTELMDRILSRTDFGEETICGWGEQLSLTGYFTTGLTLLFGLLWGIIGSPMLVRRDMAMPKLLKAEGLGAVRQVLAEYLAYLSLMSGNFILLFLPLGRLSDAAGISVPEWEGASAASLVFLLRLLPVVLLFAAMQFLLYEVISDMVSGILLQFLAGICLGFLSGCLYPLSFLPETVGRISLFLPTGAAMRYAAACMRGSFSWSASGEMCAFLLLFFGLAVWVRERRLRA